MGAGESVIDLREVLLPTVDRLATDFSGHLDREQVEHAVDDALTSLGEVRVTTYLSILVERMARKRLGPVRSG